MGGQPVNLPLERMSDQTHETDQSNKPKLVLKVSQLGKSHIIKLEVLSAAKGIKNECWKNIGIRKQYYKNMTFFQISPIVMPRNEFLKFPGVTT